MPKPPLHGSDIRGLARLATQATLGVTDLVEALHGAIAQPIGAPRERTDGIAGAVYRTVRGVTRLVGSGLDLALKQLPVALERPESSIERERLIAALNGVLGDHLAASGNPLAIEMRLIHEGQLAPHINDHSRLVNASERSAEPKWLVLVHGLCMCDRQWIGEDYSHGAALAAAHGFSPMYLRYNSGRHISENGRELAELMESQYQTCGTQPKELAFLAHSMGGLVVRSAMHIAEQSGHRWMDKLSKVAFLGTPHHGALLERGGNWVDMALGVSRFSAPFARLARIRSAGITDLRYGNVLDEHWRGTDRFERRRGARAALELPANVRSFALAASRSSGPTARPTGDGLVSIASALGQHPDAVHNLRFPCDQQWIGYAMNHFALLKRREVAEQLVRFFAATEQHEKS